jgi:hypothetical protein
MIDHWERTLADPEAPADRKRGRQSSLAWGAKGLAPLGVKIGGAYFDTNRLSTREVELLLRR